MKYLIPGLPLGIIIDIDSKSMLNEGAFGIGSHLSIILGMDDPRLIEEPHFSIVVGVVAKTIADP